MQLRHWIRLVEEHAQRIRVYHGSPEPKIVLQHQLLYGVRDFGFATSYAIDRGGRDKAFVHTFEFRFANLCDGPTLNRLLDEHDIEPWPSAAGVFISHPNFLKILIDAGYDGLTAHDFGFRSDFEELPVWMVVDAAKQARWLETVAVTKADLRHQHPPL